MACCEQDPRALIPPRPPEPVKLVCGRAQPVDLEWECEDREKGDDVMDVLIPKLSQEPAAKLKSFGPTRTGESGL